MDTPLPANGSDLLADPFAALDVNERVEPRFIPVDRDRLPLLKRLTGLYRQVQDSIAELKPARQRLGQLKGTLLDEDFVRKHPGPQPASERFMQTERSLDWAKAWFRRNPYQNAFVEFELVLANLAEDAYNLQACIHEIIDALPNIGCTLERNLAMLNLQAANRLLFLAEQEHAQAVAYLKSQPNPPANLPARPLDEAVRRLNNDSSTKYWTTLRRTPPLFPTVDITLPSLAVAPSES